jgi:hypothetical protein
MCEICAPTRTLQQKKKHKTNKCTYFSKNCKNSVICFFIYLLKSLRRY